MQYSNPLEEELLRVTNNMQKTGEAPSNDEHAQLIAAVLAQQAQVVDALSLVAERMERINRRLEEVEADIRSYKERRDEAAHIVKNKLEELDEIPQDIRDQAKARLMKATEVVAQRQRAEALANGMEVLSKTEEDGFEEFNWEYEVTYFRFGDVVFVVRPGRNRIPKTYYPEIRRNIEMRKKLELQKQALSAERSYRSWDEVKPYILGG